jgi:hypothetical protein
MLNSPSLITEPGSVQMFCGCGNHENIKEFEVLA